MLTPWLDVERTFAELDALRRTIHRPLPSEAAPTPRLRDTGDALVAQVELPGVLEGDVKIEVTPEALSIAAHRVTSAPEGYTAARLERAGWRFARSWPLPVAVDVDTTTATLTDGLLTITLPKRASARPRVIPVNPSN